MWASDTPKTAMMIELTRPRTLDVKSSVFGTTAEHADVNCSVDIPSLSWYVLDFGFDCWDFEITAKSVRIVIRLTSAMPVMPTTSGSSVILISGLINLKRC